MIFNTPLTFSEACVRDGSGIPATCDTKVAGYNGQPGVQHSGTTRPRIELKYS